MSWDDYQFLSFGNQSAVLTRKYQNSVRSFWKMRPFSVIFKHSVCWWSLLYVVEAYFSQIRVMSHASAALLLSFPIPKFSKMKTAFSQVVNCRPTCPAPEKRRQKHLWMPGWTYFSCSLSLALRYRFCPPFLLTLALLWNNLGKVIGESTCIPY